MLNFSAPVKHETILQRRARRRGSCFFDEQWHKGYLRESITEDEPNISVSYVPAAETYEQRIAKLEIMLELQMAVMRGYLARESEHRRSVLPESEPSLKGDDYPLLAAIWDNPSDDIFDAL